MSELTAPVAAELAKQMTEGNNPGRTSPRTVFATSMLMDWMDTKIADGIPAAMVVDRLISACEQCRTPEEAIVTAEGMLMPHQLRAAQE